VVEDLEFNFRRGRKNKLLGHLAYHAKARRYAMEIETEVYERPTLSEVGDFAELTLGGADPNIPDFFPTSPYLPRLF
jgi:hypothetical protein